MNKNPNNTPNTVDDDDEIVTMSEVMEQLNADIEARVAGLAVDPRADYRQTIKDWYIDKDGNLEHRPTGYDIAAASLTQTDWISHMRQKAWCNLADFIPAYFLALEQAGVRQITIDLYGWRTGYKFAGE